MTEATRGEVLGRRRRWRLMAAVLMAGATALAGGLVVTAGDPVASAAGNGSGAKVLRVLVTNDDGVGAPGINAAVQALRKLPHTKVTVVAPFTTESGSGGKTTAGKLVVTEATTQSGYPAKAVHGYPADTIVWAIADHGLRLRPDLVVSGINFGENVGTLATISGTVGAARAAYQQGIPALATSQGIDNGTSPDFSEGAAQLVAWVQAHRAALLAHRYRKPPSGSLNVPTCPGGAVRGPVDAPLAATLTGVNLGQVDCAAAAAGFANDAQAFVNGYAVISPLYPTQPKS